MTPVQLAMVLRLPKGDECACVPCGLIFAGESAFGRHITRRGHVDPVTVGLVECDAGGTVWTVPAPNDTSVTSNPSSTRVGTATKSGAPATALRKQRNGPGAVSEPQGGPNQ